MSIQINGFCDERFVPVKEAFMANFDDGLELGASLAMTWGGRVVAELWAGFADTERMRSWGKDTLCPVASKTKIMIMIAAAIVIDRRLLDIDAPVARYWPEFAQGGKESVTVRDALTHQAGVPGYVVPLTNAEFCDWDTACARLAAEPHWFEGRCQICYHGMTIGFICGELVRRVDGRGPRQFFKEGIADKIGADFQFGLSDTAERARLASVTQEAIHTARTQGGVLGRMYNSVPTWNPEDWTFMSAELPGINGVGTAHALARVGAIMALGGELDGVRFLSPALVAAGGQPQAEGVCPILVPITSGLGFGLHNRAYPAPTPTCIHWGGFGGSWVVIDPRAQISFAYTPNNWRIEETFIDKRLARFWRVLAELLPTL